MKEIILKSQISYYDTCAEFASEFNLGSDDLILTNEYIYTPYFGKLGLDVHTIFQEAPGQCPGNRPRCGRPAAPYLPGDGDDAEPARGRAVGKRPQRHCKVL